MGISRRDFLSGAASLLLSSAISTPVLARVSFKSNPFSLGIASGAPRPDSLVLWTRLAPDPLNGGGLDPHPIAVRWELAADEGFHRLVRSGKAIASPQYAHSVHVEVNGLEPGRKYWYRFFAADAVSETGQTQTAPAPNAITPVNFAFASCQMFEQGYFTAHKYMAQEELNAVIFLGDYIYEHSWGDNDIRKHEITGEVRTLEQYRNRYARYKTDQNLQLCHASFPWIVTWDDHEVSNDYARDQSEDLDQHFLARRQAAYQAYWEHMPLPRACAPHNNGMHLYSTYDFGQMARFHVLDDRQYRDYQACPKPGRGGSNMVKDCPELLDAHRTMLGAQQERWLQKNLNDSRANWDIVVQQTLMAQAIHEGGTVWTDGWDGYPAARRRLLEAIDRGGERDSIVVGGDIHAWAVCDLKLDYEKAKSPTLATEFCGTSISSQGPADKETNQLLSLNPHMHYANGNDRGYTKIRLEKGQARADLRAISSVKTIDGSMRTLAQYIVEKGKPGAQKV